MPRTIAGYNVVLVVCPQRLTPAVKLPSLRHETTPCGSTPLGERRLPIPVPMATNVEDDEDVDLTNYTQQPVEFELKLEVAADFADQEETVKKREQFGHLTESWRKNDQDRRELLFDYVACHHYDHQGDAGDTSIHRSVTLQIADCTTTPTYVEHCISFKVSLDPLEHWHTCVLIAPHIEGEPDYPLYECYAFEPTESFFDVSRRRFLDEAAAFTTPVSQTLAPVVVSALEQAKHDQASLRLHDLDQGERAWIMAAGISIFVALFGRDTLTASCQAGMVSSQMIQGILPALARLQGTKVDDWRDEQPGRMLHEAHTGPLATLGFNPRARYYGAATTSGFYPFAVTELWHWTGDKDLVPPFVEPALRALQWKDTWADLNGDGFTEYLTHSKQGTKNQGWKDSGDAIVYEDGTQVEPPIAMCEEQAFLYDGPKLR